MREEVGVGGRVGAQPRAGFGGEEGLAWAWGLRVQVENGVGAGPGAGQSLEEPLRPCAHSLAPGAGGDGPQGALVLGGGTLQGPPHLRGCGEPQPRGHQRVGGWAARAPQPAGPSLPPPPAGARPPRGGGLWSCRSNPNSLAVQLRKGG